MNKICHETRRVKERAILLRICMEAEYEGCQTWSTLARPMFACGLYPKRERALSAGITSDRFRVGGANLATSPRFREKRVTWSVIKSTSLFNYRAWWGAATRATKWQTWLQEVPLLTVVISHQCHLRSVRSYQQILSMWVRKYLDLCKENLHLSQELCESI